MKRLAHFDLWTGLSGDMWVGAFLDAGWPLERLQEGVSALGLGDVTVEVESRRHHGLVGQGIVVRPQEGHAHRGLSDILAILDRSSLPGPVIGKAGDVFRRLAAAEARVHGLTVEQVHFHEVGAHDAIVDIALGTLAVHDLEVAVTAGAIPVTKGEVEMAHGRWPVPAPATALLLEGWPVRPENVEGEFITPTGAALLGEFATPRELIPPMTITKVGYGAGTREHPSRPNVVRLWLGNSSITTPPSSPQLTEITVLETQVDDMDPRWFATLASNLLAAGALDVFSEAVSMKKGRWGSRLTVICRPDQESELVAAIFCQSTTLGVRRRTESRWELERGSETVETPWGAARMKWILRSGRRVVRFESEDILLLAEAEGLAPAEMEAQLDQWWSREQY